MNRHGLSSCAVKTSKHERRVLALGLDAAEKDVIFRLAREGVLPTFARLIGSAAWAETDSPPGLYAGAIWPSFWTSVSPARHGRYHFEQLVPGTYDVQRVHPDAIPVAPFWETLACAGLRVAVIDVPKTRTAQDFNGVHVVDWGTHDPDFEGPVTWPENLRGEIVDRFGVDVVGNCNANRFEAHEYAVLRDALVARVHRKRELIEQIMAMERWDCVVAAFAESHCVGHQCWHLHDVTHAAHDRKIRDEIGDPVVDVYVALDDALGKLISTADADTDVFVFSSHGMRPHYNGTFLLDEMLKRIERPHRATAGKGTIRKAKRAWMMIPGPLRRILRPLKTSTRAGLGIAPASSRKSYPVPNGDVYGAIRLNTVGREPQGKIAPGDEFDSWCAFLDRELMSFVNSDTGGAVVNRVMRVTDLYDGPYVAAMPDLLVEWNYADPIARVHSQRAGEITGAYPKYRTGDHLPIGVVFCAGESVRAGRIEHSVRIVDIAPTIAERLGVDLGDIDGVSFAAAAFGTGDSGAVGT